MLSQTGEHSRKGPSLASAATTTATRIPHRPPSMMALYRDIIRHEGVLGLWAGNGANLLRVFPAKAIVFSSNDVYKAFLLNTFMPTNDASGGGSSSNHNNNLAGPLAFLAGGMSGMSASLLTYPMDFARGRISGTLASRPVVPDPTVATTTATATAVANQSTKMYKGIMQTIVLTVKDEGFMALYKGVTPTLLGAMPYEGIKFGTVGLLELYFPKGDGSDGNSDMGFLHHPHYPLRKMAFGAAGGIMAGIITFPNDTVRRLLQISKSSSSSSSAAVPGALPHFTGYWQCVRYIYRHYGITRFYSGCAINIIRMAPNTAIQFGSYELLKKWTDGMFD
jgi:solute carrier family 25 (mitochondrial phosphate transporter), member 23/24/25/41